MLGLIKVEKRKDAKMRNNEKKSEVEGKETKNYGSGEYLALIAFLINVVLLAGFSLLYAGQCVGSRYLVVGGLVK